MITKPWPDYPIYTTLLTFRNLAQKTPQYKSLCHLLNSAQRELPVYSARPTLNKNDEENNSYQISCSKFLRQYNTADQALLGLRRCLREYSYEHLGQKLTELEDLFRKLCATSLRDEKYNTLLEQEVFNVLEDIQEMKRQMRKSGREWMMMVDVDVVFEELGKIWGEERVRASGRDTEGLNRLVGDLEWEMGVARTAGCVGDALRGFFGEVFRWDIGGEGG
jgi:hypothetical protein